MASKGARNDPAWDHSEEVQVPGEGAKKGYKYLKCNYCSKVIKGEVKRMKEHLAGSRKDVAPCLNVPDIVKEEMKQYH